MRKYNHRDFSSLFAAKCSYEDIRLIEDAYNISKYGHRNQKRDQGGRYFEHPKSVAIVVAKELSIIEPTAIAMALLHDILEDSFVLSSSGLEKMFGTRIASGVQVLSKNGSLEYYLDGLNMCLDDIVLIVKFADRLHNLRTMAGVQQEKRVRKIAETKNHYLPLLKRRIQDSPKEYLAPYLYLQGAIIEQLQKLETIKE